MILTKGEKPLDLHALLKDVKTKTIVHYPNGFIKVVLEDKSGIEKLKELGFIDAV
jgi:hypothetical protein